MPPIEYVRAEGITHALEVLSQHGPEARILAGGTDLLVDMRERRQGPRVLVDISEIPELATVREDGEAVRLGACVTVSALRASATVKREFPVLTEAGRHFADYLTQNKATIGGNLANASPGADLAVPLLAAGAYVVIASLRGERTLSLDQFLQGPRSTALAPDELLTEIVIPRPAQCGQSFEKLGLKQAGSIAVVSVAVLMDVAEGRCSRVRIGLGAVAPRPFRPTSAEDCLEGGPFSAERVDQAGETAANAAQPISDVRATAEYRRAMVRVLVQRGLDTAHAKAMKCQEDRRLEQAVHSERSDR